MPDVTFQEHDHYEVSFYIGPCSEEDSCRAADAIMCLPEAVAVHVGAIRVRRVAEETSMPDVTVTEHDDRFVFGNLDGIWVVYKRHVQRQGALSVGPGYIARAILRNGSRLCDGYYPTATSANDPRVQGIGLVGYHWYRALPEANIWERGWDVDGHKPGPFGVTHSDWEYPLTIKDTVSAWFRVVLGDGWNPHVMTVEYGYVFSPSQVRMWVKIETHDVPGPTCFIKEPKLCVGLGPPTKDGARFRSADVYRADGSLLTSFSTEQGDPAKNTRQIGFDTRCRVSLLDMTRGGNYLNIVARGVDQDGMRHDWERGDSKAAAGLDLWARRSNHRKMLQTEPCGAYCLQGKDKTLTRQWELAKRPGEPGVELMLHAWEGGSGLPDCLCCARAYVGGERYTSYLSISKGAGWTI